MKQAEHVRAKFGVEFREVKAKKQFVGSRVVQEASKNVRFSIILFNFFAHFPLTSTSFSVFGPSSACKAAPIIEQQYPLIISGHSRSIRSPKHRQIRRKISAQFRDFVSAEQEDPLN